jgi:hypothetical protein
VAEKLTRLRFALVFALAISSSGCQRPYRVGDYVLVEWGDERQLYPAFIISKKDDGHFRVHFDGYPSRWDEDVTLDRVKGTVTNRTFPPPPKHVRALQGDTIQSPSALLSRFKPGDKVKARWRNSSYRATVLEVVSPGKLRIHYDGHEAAWDEVVDISRLEAAL